MFRASYCSGFLVDALRFGSLSFQLFTTSLTFLTALLCELGLCYVLLSEGCSFRILVSCYCCYFTWQVMNKDSLSKSQGRAKSNESFLPVLWCHVGRKLQQCRR